MQKFIQKPDIQMYEGIVVDKDTVIEYKNENVKQTLKNLVFRSITKVKGEGYESQYKTTIILKEGEVLIFDGEGRGYIKPVETFMTVQETIDELSCIKDL